MSWQPAGVPMCHEKRRPIDVLIEPRARNLGGFEVRRVLPSARRRSVGPFVFFDEMGPAAFPAGEGIDVRPHPHIGLATVTYLFEGEILHRDSLGSVQPIQPGALNWMTAGRGITHSERTPPALRAEGQRLHGIQSWVALPRDLEETAPDFQHFPADSLPVVERDGATLRLIAGEAYGERAPVETALDLIYLEANLKAEAPLPLPEDKAELAVYVVTGDVRIGDAPVAPGRMAVLSPEASCTVTALSKARLMLLGGAPVDAKRYMWWNFVSSSEARIEQAKADWRDGRFPQVPGEDDIIPLPET